MNMMKSYPTIEQERVLVICVNYYNEEETCAFVKQVLKQKESIPVNVVIANNNESNERDFILNACAKANDRVALFNTGENLGYFGAANHALLRYCQESPLPEWVIVSNTDICFEDDEFFVMLIEVSGNRPHEIIAPSIISLKTGLNQNPHRRKRPSRLRMHSYKWIFRNYHVANGYSNLGLIKAKIKRALHHASKLASQAGRPLSIYAPQGSFVIFNRKYFECGGDFDYGSVLMGEEIFVAETALRLGLKVSFIPQLRVIHREHSTTWVLRMNRELQYLSAKYCADKYFRYGPFKTK